MSCEGCGACCLGMGIPPFNGADWADGDGDIDWANPDWMRLPEALKAEVEAVWARGADLFAGRPCIWFDKETRRCRNYEWRPETCARFEPGGWVCNEDRSTIGLAELVTAGGRGDECNCGFAVVPGGEGLDVADAI